jgi:hypothetical protein
VNAGQQRVAADGASPAAERLVRLHSDGEAKFWLEPDVALAQNHGLTPRQVSKALSLVKEHQDEVRSAWKTHFER